MADAAALRHALASFLGDERYRKFVQQGVRKGRLRHWQEEEWTRFVTARAEFVVPLDELAAALRVCELHGLEMLPDTIQHPGPVRDPHAYFEAFTRLLPHAAKSPMPEDTSLEPDGLGQYRVWYCPACRRAESEWVAQYRSQWAEPDPLDDVTWSRVEGLLDLRRGRLGPDRRDELLPEEREVTLLQDLHMEVTNGGLHQYLWNSAGDQAADLITVLDKLGSLELVALVRSVLSVLPGGWCADRAERCRRLQAVPDVWDVFEDLDARYDAAVEADAAVMKKAGRHLFDAYRREGIIA